MKNLTKENFGTGRSILTGVAVFLLMFMGCDNATSPNQDLTNSYDTPVTMQSGDEINTTIDELPIYTVPGFYFLAPMVKGSEYSGTFDAGLSPVVEICETTACATIHKSFDMDEDGSEGVRLDEEDEHYIVNWHTDQTGTEVGQTYRIRVSVAGTVLAHADIQMAENGRDAKNITDDEAIALVDGRTLPIKFRVEEGAVYVTDSGGGTITSEDGLVTLEIPENAIDGTIGITISSAMDELDDEDVIPGTLFDFGPSPFMFNEPVILTITFDPTNLPVGVSEDELRLLAVVDEEWVQLPGSSVDLSNSTVTGPLENFSRKGVGRGKVNEIVVTPADASIEVGDTQQFEATITNVDGEEMNRNVRWSSSDEEIATVDGTGLAAAVALGEVEIEARSGKVTGTAELTVEVSGPVVTTVTVSPAEATITEGSTAQFTATVYDQNDEVMDDETITWSSGDSGIASVDEAGLVFGLNEGETTIIANAGSINGTAQLTVSGSAIIAAWQSMDTGMNNRVMSLTVQDDDLIAGGWFTTASGQTANRVARWDGSAWQPMGAGMDDSVYSVIVYDGDLIAGGSFTTASGQTANRVARWDGSAWQPMGTGMNNRVFSLTVHAGDLVAGGDFTTASGQTANRVARWDGSAWQPMSTGMNGTVTSLVIHDGDLIAGGSFTSASGKHLYRVARWDGSEWNSIGTGMNGTVWSLAIHAGDLIAGGSFTSAWWTSTADHIARWNGSSWGPIGTGPGDTVVSLTVHNGELIAGGTFNIVNGSRANHISSWDGEEWQPMGTGMNGTVWSLAIHAGDLIAGGSFTTSNGETTNYIARWVSP